jgi:hypothetical protein
MFVLSLSWHSFGLHPEAMNLKREALLSFRLDVGRQRGVVMCPAVGACNYKEETYPRTPPAMDPID